MKKRSDFKIAFKLLFLVKPLLFFMLLAVILGIAGHLIASFITIMGGYAIAALLQFPVFVSVTTALLLAGFFAGIRGFFRYGEQLCNHYIAFKLLTLIREQVFKALRRLCPAKLEGKDKGNLISLITADVELLEVFYAHTISPVLIALGYSLFICFFISGIHFSLGLLTVIVHLFIGVLIPLWVASSTKNEGRAYRTAAGQLSTYVLESLRGLSETIQYHNSAERLKEMDRQGALLSSQEKRMKQLSGRTLSVSSLLILISDFAMLLLASQLYLSGTIGFDGLLIAFLALSSSFGPVISLANLGSGLQNTFAAGNRILDLLEEAPETNEIAGQPAVSFS
ncbi:MAG: ATP-binding cassette, subfamily bacterial, partial [Acetobacterium sp.]|nr:ATP-binding cassette, subfamily bacterial [Acetobacterium sp.]